MFSSGSWFHITFGIMLGVIFTGFIVVIARLLKRDRSFKKRVVALFIFSLSVVLIFNLYISAISGGILIDWQFLGLPAIGEHAVRVIDIGYVETKTGNIYHSVCEDCQDKNWELVNEVPKSPEDMNNLQTSNCGTLSFLPFQRRDFIDAKSICKSVMWGTTKISYAVDEGGHVYSWIHTYYPGDVVMPWYVANSAHIAVAVLSTVFGAIIILLMVLFNRIISKVRKNHVQTG